MRPGLVLALLVAVTGCDRSRTASPEEAPVVVFRAADGRMLTIDELREMTGTFRYEVVGGESVPAEAESLHKRARQAGGAGDYEKALADLERASKLAPRWPYPVYDTAFTYLLMKDFDKARAYYQRTVELAPRGFFTAITALDSLGREQTGDLPPGTYLAYLSLEWVDDPGKKEQAVRRLVEQVPRFAPGWKELADLSDDDAGKLAAIEKGLAANPDAETRGFCGSTRR